MIIAFDTETYIEHKDKSTEMIIKQNGNNNKLTIGNRYPILDATGKYFIIGSIVDQNFNKYIFTNKDEMWNKIIEMGIAERAKGKVLYAYAHNAKYDFFNIAKYDKNLTIIAESPFIAKYEKEKIRAFNVYDEAKNYEKYLQISRINYKKEEIGGIYYFTIKEEIIKFLDSQNIFTLKLEDLGDIIGLQKGAMPLELKEINEIKPYVTTDSEIVVKGLKMLKDKIRNDGIKIKRLVTINQIAMTYLIKLLKDKKAPIFSNKVESQVIQSRFKNIIRKSYRGGRIEIWNNKMQTNVNYIDFNSLFPYSAMKMKFPILSTEAFYNHPTKKEWKNLLSRPGVCRAMILNESNEIGLLPIRLAQLSYYPKKGKYLIGTWTNEEVLKCIREGYKIIDIQYIINYVEYEHNPFTEIIPELYKKRLTDNKMDNYYYKSIMNRGMGKFGQIRQSTEIIIEDINEITKELKNNYNIITGLNNKSKLMKLEKKDKPTRNKPYYCPILISNITAKARCIMYDYYKIIAKTFGVNSLIYTATDSILFKGDLNKLKGLLPFGNEIGQFKIVKEGIPFTAYSRLNTQVDGELRLSGVTKNDIRNFNPKLGEIKYRKMEGFKSKNPGEFTEVTRNIFEMSENYVKVEEEISKQKVYIDESIRKDMEKRYPNSDKPKDSLDYFKNHIKLIV